MNTTEIVTLKNDWAEFKENNQLRWLYFHEPVIDILNIITIDSVYKKQISKRSNRTFVRLKLGDEDFCDITITQFSIENVIYDFIPISKKQKILIGDYLNHFQTVFSEFALVQKVPGMYMSTVESSSCFNLDNVKGE